jgi:hypothetical protein
VQNAGDRNVSLPRPIHGPRPIRPRKCRLKTLVAHAFSVLGYCSILMSSTLK